MIKQAEIVEIPKPKLKVLKKDTTEIKSNPLQKELKRNVISKEINLNTIYKEAVIKYEDENYSDSLILFEKVEHKLTSAKEKLQDEAEFYFYLIKNYMKLGKLKKANSFCDKSLKKEKLDYRIHYLHGILLQENGEFEKAEAAYNKSIYLNNKFPLSYFALANLQMSAGKDSYKKNFQKTAKLVLGLETDEIVKYSDGITAGDLLKQITLHTE